MSNPNSSLSVIILVVLDTTNKLIDQKFPLVTCKKRRFPQLSWHPFSQENVISRQPRGQRPKSVNTPRIVSSISYIIHIVILVPTNQRDYYCYNEPSAVSSYLVFKLTHAWLNL